MIAHMSLSLVPNNLSNSQLQSVRNLIIDVADGSVAIINSTGFGTSLSGTNFYWGSNGQLLNDLMIMGAAYDITGDSRYHIRYREFDFPASEEALRRYAVFWIAARSRDPFPFR